MLHIRRYQKSDYRQVMDLHGMTTQRAGAYKGPAAWDDDLQAIEQAYLSSRGEFLVGLVDRHRIVAMGAFREIQPGRAELKRMRTHPDWQGHGFGHMMLRALEVRAAQEGHSVLQLEIPVVHTPAQGLYRKHGFVETGRMERGGLACIVYEKQLLPRA